jgi:hypothetical protein
LPGATEIIIDRTTDSRFVVNYFQDFKQARWSIPIKRIVYATMKNNDIALVELATNIGSMRKAGIQTLKLSPTLPQSGEPMKVVGIPGEGVAPKSTYLHKATCQIGDMVVVKEDVYTWQKSIRHRCSIVGGMSGSPMISLKTNRVVGIVNTGVNDSSNGQAQCSLNRPCEIQPDGSTKIQPTENYGQPVDRLAGCFNREQIFDLYQSSCKLEKP